VFLALGAWRIARHRVLARRPAAVETLGAVTVLCVDKTGTLTENRIGVARLVTADAAIDAGGALPEEVHALVEVALLACPREPTDPIDRAIAALAGDRLAGTEHLHPRWIQVREYPLRAGLLAVTHVWRGDGERTIVATKGAPEAILDLCHLDEPAAAAWRARAEAMAADGLRVLGVARAIAPAGAPPPDAHDFAFEPVGLLGLADPIRRETRETVAACRAAGMRVVMITGDHPATARAIARAAGIPADDVVTGAELDGLDDRALGERLARTHVIARAVPAHKLRIVQALRARGEVVGMTGDGVNDAPALAAADIGVAMGARGTDVAREAAALVLLDDALAAIVPAVRTGRRIHDNIRKSVGYTLAVHVPIAGLALLPPLFGWGAILAPVHVVFLELLIDPTCSIVLELEPEEPGVMTRPPRRPGTPLLGARRMTMSLVQGALALGAALGVVAWGHAVHLAAGSVRALGFVALIAGNLAILAASRAGDAPFWRSRARNRAALALGAAAATLAAIALAVPALRALFGFAPAGAGALATAALAGAAPVLLADLLKAITRAR
jgi:P-type Ca2+ transporter type 2C